MEFYMGGRNKVVNEHQLGLNHLIKYFKTLFKYMMNSSMFLNVPVCPCICE
jgi:hypothetical protein